MKRMLDRVRWLIEQDRLLTSGDRVVVGVSGGPDSLCLLHLLHRLQAEYDLALHVAHLHHSLRGADADADAAFVRQIAAAWGLPCTVEQADVPALAAEGKLAVEEAARQARYAFLRRVAIGVGARIVAVGHNADDQAETVLMHFIRGSGLAGLRGMLPRAPYPQFTNPQSTNSQSTSPHLTLIRPLLDISRADILAYCDRHGLTPRFDRSNLDTTYFRNWLRHEALPLLARHNPNVDQVLRRTAR
ncbi:MAG TPA: tRNA lysidine(34) synthetase TilS, partial [Anaerolineae bacterium]|nr:tRNA lysidine(34) synthetase TilS [Anaerolineae bacterium]